MIEAYNQPMIVFRNIEADNFWYTWVLGIGLEYFWSTGGCSWWEASISGYGNVNVYNEENLENWHILWTSHSYHESCKF